LKGRGIGAGVPTDSGRLCLVKAGVAGRGDSAIDGSEASEVANVDADLRLTPGLDEHDKLESLHNELSVEELGVDGLRGRGGGVDLLRGCSARGY
jgi:hypothetical protein